MQADYVIIGAGSAGCVVAARLSEDPGVSVILLEAGGRDRNPWLHIPVGYFKTMHDPRVDWMYRTEPEPHLNGRRIEWPRGKVLGGSSALNGLLYIRGHPLDYDGWRQMGNTGWGWEDVRPLFLRSEDQERGASDHHGVGGPLAVSNMRVPRDLTERYLAAAEQAGVPRNDDFNGESLEGAGYYQQTMRKGWRCSAATAYLKPARRRQNLRVLTHAQTSRILFDGGRATGVEAAIEGALVRVMAGKEVVLCAGAIGSPQILQLSGVGPGQALRDAGVDVIHDLPGVGENLQDHLQSRMVFRVNTPTLNDEVNNFFRRMMIGAEYVMFRSGPMSMGASQVGLFARVDPAAAAPEIQFHVQPLSSRSPGHGLDRFSAFTTSVTQLRPESRGDVRITSPDPGAHPAIRANYLESDTDRRLTVAGVRLSREVAAAPALSDLITEEMEPGAPAETDSEILDWVRERTTTIYHPVGTCKMGDDANAVVDARLRTRGLGGLRVVDASIMPTITSGNTNAPAIMIGEKAADMIREDAA